jgi:hypothetical protein
MTNWLIALGLLAIIVAGLVWLARAMRAGGAAQERVHTQEDMLDAIRDRKEITDDVQRLPDATARERLRKWAVRK